MGNVQSAIPEKNSFYQTKEHFAEDLPVWSKDGFEIVKIKVDELFAADEEKLKQIGERVVEGLSKDNIIILQNSNSFYENANNALSESKSFLSKSQEEKTKFKSDEINGKRAFYSGYSLIHFENRDNKRDKEWRDVFQVRCSEEDHIPWPSEEYKKAILQHYGDQWSICVKVLHALALALSLSPLSLLSLVVGEGKSHEDINKSVNSNLSLFRYFDKFMSYKTPQRCMIHKDHGLLTLLPKTEVPGLELLHPGLQQWIPIEQFVDSNDVLLYCGEALSVVTGERVGAATHRVVRLPERERFSMPFELKPNDDAVIENLFSSHNHSVPTTFSGLTKRLQWERIMKQVDRADGIEPMDVTKVKEAIESDEKPNFGQAHHDVQLPSISVQ